MMQCRLIKRVRSANPAYDKHEALRARRAGEDYPIPRTVELEPGAVLEGPMVWVHCCPGSENTPPVAEPVDEECKSRVADYFDRVRPARIEQLKRLARMPKAAFRSPQQYEWIQHLAASYGLVDAEPAAVSPAKTAARAEQKSASSE